MGRQHFMWEIFHLQPFVVSARTKAHTTTHCGRTDGARLPLKSPWFHDAQRGRKGLVAVALKVTDVASSWASSGNG
jgi:hypothetical protein